MTIEINILALFAVFCGVVGCLAFAMACVPERDAQTDTLRWRWWPVVVAMCLIAVSVVLLKNSDAPIAAEAHHAALIEMEADRDSLLEPMYRIERALVSSRIIHGERGPDGWTFELIDGDNRSSVVTGTDIWSLIGGTTQ